MWVKVNKHTPARIYFNWIENSSINPHWKRVSIFNEYEASGRSIDRLVARNEFFDISSIIKCKFDSIHSDLFIDFFELIKCEMITLQNKFFYSQLSRFCMTFYESNTSKWKYSRWFRVFFLLSPLLILNRQLHFEWK